jgi:hypothetical protein
MIRFSSPTFWLTALSRWQESIHECILQYLGSCLATSKLVLLSLWSCRGQNVLQLDGRLTPSVLLLATTLASQSMGVGHGRESRLELVGLNRHDPACNTSFRSLGAQDAS